MTIITFIFLGEDVKIQVDGTRTIDKSLEDDPQLKELLALNNVLFQRKHHRHHKAYEWCTENCHKTFKKGRNVNFVL